MEQLEFVRNIDQAPFGSLWLIVAAPLLGFILNGLRTLVAAGRRQGLGENTTSFIACSGSALSFLFACQAFFALRAQPEGTLLTQTLFPWIEAGTLRIQAGLQMDALSAFMVLFVTAVSALIHVYSIGYMKKDPGYTRYFSYLNLFLFFMLLLVLADSLLLMFVGWEGVGLCSYLLISFWFEDEAKAEAGKKAFLANRIGDAGFLIGIFILFAATGTLHFNEIQATREALDPRWVTAACLAFFLGAVGKSAQIPLYVWLPDAMAGPTPVSALIHAATMVTAGVYMVARLHFLYALSPLALTVVAAVGIVTALMAATIAVAQNDIKKVLAYSTISQLGLMFVAAGTGGYAAGLFHVMTHAFFKAGLFLGAGSVIHAMHGKQDIRDMGGLIKHIPVTGITFAIAGLSLAGFPFFSGFFSKDEILWRALATPNLIFPWMPWVLFTATALVSLLTAFYITRLMILVFFGEFRGTREEEEEVHESPKVMTWPLMILAFFAITIGWLGAPKAIGGGQRVDSFLEPVFGHSTPEASAFPLSVVPILMLFSGLVVCVGIAWAWMVYYRKSSRSPGWIRFFEPLKTLLQNKYYVDEFYDRTVLAFTRGFARWFSVRFIDQMIIERTVEGLAATAQQAAQWTRRIQVGTVRVYLAYLLVGTALLLYLVSR